MGNMLNAIITISSVMIGGLITYWIGQREIKKNKKLEVYLEFLNLAHGRYLSSDHENHELYFNIMRKLYLVANKDVLDALLKSGYLPDKNKKWSDKDPIEKPFKHIILAMRKDIGNTDNVNEFDFINYFYK